MISVVVGVGEATKEDVEDVCQRLRDGDYAGSSIELSRLDSAWPMLSLLINGAWCIVHLTTAKDGQLFTLASDSAVGAPEELEVMYAGVPTVFTSEYINSLATATRMIHAFAVNAPWPESAEWDEL